MSVIKDPVVSGQRNRSQEYVSVEFNPWIHLRLEEKHQVDPASLSQAIINAKSCNCVVGLTVHEGNFRGTAN